MSRSKPLDLLGKRREVRVKRRFAMPDVSKRASGRQDISSTLRVCPHCLGDLEFRGAAGSGYYACLQCGTRSNPHARVGRRLDTPLARGSGPYMTADALVNRVPF